MLIKSNLSEARKEEENLKDESAYLRGYKDALEEVIKLLIAKK